MKTTKPSKQPTTVLLKNSSATEPTHEEIARRAYAIWEEKSCPPNQDCNHWFQAEAELRQARLPRAVRT